MLRYPIQSLQEDYRWSLFKPAAPTSVTATSGNAQAVVSWTAPAVVVPPLTDYSVQFSTNGGTTWTTASDAVSTATSATITGLTNGAAYVFRVAGINGIGAGAYSTQSAAVTPTAGDPLFSNVALLLPMDGTGSTFVDASAVPKTVAAVGATQSATESRWGGKSAYFSGAGDYLSFPDVGITTGNFVIEMWFKTASDVQYAQLIGNEANGGSPGFTLMTNHNSATGGQIALYRSGQLKLLSSSGDWSDNQWHHLALVRSGSALRLYLDGSLNGTGSDGDSYDGAEYNVGRNRVYSGRDMQGYIDDLRITVNSDRNYTGESITVPTAAFPTS